MRTLQIVLFVLGACALGCKTDPNQALLERDLRLQEDRIYELEAMLDDCCAARQASVRENQALKKELAGGDRGAGPDYRSPSVELPPSESRPERRPSRDDSPKLEPPTIEMPEPSSEPPAEMKPGGKSALIGEGPPTQLVINKRLTGGLDRGSDPGDEGILVAFEPRDAQGRLVKGPGAVSVVVLDPALEGEAGRVARWDFEPDEVPSHFHKTPFGQGLQFELPWPSNPPKNRDLKLFVRFTTPQGRKITTESPLVVRTADDLPKIDRKTKGSTAQKGNRQARSATPVSRMKSPHVALSEPREIRASDQAEEAEEAAANETRDADEARDAVGAQEADDAGEPEVIEETQPAPKQSKPQRAQPVLRAERPLWKPYR